MASGKSNSIDVRPQQMVPRPRIRWENGSYTMDEILRKFHLPNVVQCDTAISDISRERSNFDFVQPMLLYSKRSCMKVIGHSLDLNKTTKTANEVGNQLLVPEDYKGWFAVLNKNKVNAPVPHYAQVDLLSQSDCDTFLIGGTENVDAVQRLKDDKSPEARILYPGEVLKMGNTYTASTKVRNSVFGKSQVKDMKFLLCIDQNDREVLLPFGSKGLFYVIKTKHKRPPIRVMQIKDVVNNVQLPCVVKLLFGLTPSSPCLFTGLMVLKQSFEEFSAIASSIVNLRNILLEIPSDIPIKFKVAAEGNDLEDNVGFRNAFRLCQEKADTYMRNIKVSQGFISGDIDIPETEAPLPPTEKLPEQHQPQPQRPSILEGVIIFNSPPNSKQFQLPLLPEFQNKESPSQRSPGTQQVKAPSVSAGRYGQHASTSSTKEHPHATQGPETPPAVPPRLPRDRGPSVATSTPSPPPQSAKPGILERVVSSSSAPPSMVAPSDGATQRQQPQVDSHAMLAKPIGNYDSVSPRGVLNKTPAKKQVPETPPKPSSNISRHKPLRISVNNTYLTVPIYLTPQHIDSPAAAEDDTVSNKMNFWKNLDRCSRDIVTNEANKQASSKQDTGIASSPGSRQNQVGGRAKATAVYETIDDLMVIQTQARQQSLDTSDDDSTSDDVIYEMPSLPDDDVVYENPECVIPGGALRTTHDGAGMMRPRNYLSSQRPHIDSGINMDDEEESDTISDAVTRMTGPEVCDRLKTAGLKKDTIELLKKNKVDGRLLASHNTQTLKEAFPNLTNIEIMKIGLFLQGFEL